MSITSAKFEIPQDGPQSKDEHEEIGRDDDRLAKIAKMGNETFLGHLDGLQNVQELDINVTEKQA